MNGKKCSVFPLVKSFFSFVKRFTDKNIRGKNIPGNIRIKKKKKSQVKMLEKNMHVKISDRKKTNI